MTETPLIKHEVLFVTNYHKLFMNSDYARNIREIGEISAFWLIHDNSRPKHHSASMKFFLKKITLKSAE